jgi:hypothetical protein
MQANLPNTNVWTLTFALSEYTPAEIERMTGVSTASQRDWRRHGYLPRQETHARFNVLTAAELYVMKMFADQGKGPAVSSAYAVRIALSMVKTALIWRAGVWGESDPVAAFDAIPSSARVRTRTEAYYLNHNIQPRGDDEPTPDEKIEWIVDSLFRQLGVAEYIPHSRQAIWWPNGEVEIASYSDEHFSVRNEGVLDRIDPKFDGPASVLHLEACAANLARRSRLPFLTVDAAINENGVINRPELHANHGEIVVVSGSAKRAAEAARARMRMRARAAGLSVDDEASAEGEKR